MGWYLMIWFDLVWYGIGIMKYIHTRYCIVCIVSIYIHLLCRYYSNMWYISLIHRYFIASLFSYFRVFIVFVSYNSYYEVNGPCFRKQHVNLNDRQLNLRYKLLHPKSSCFFMFVTILVSEKNILNCFVHCLPGPCHSTWELFWKTEPRYFHSETKVLARRFEDELKRPALSGELVSEKTSERISWNFNGKCCVAFLVRLMGPC